MESFFTLRLSNENHPPVKEINPFESWEDYDDNGEKKPAPPASLDMDTCPNCFNIDCLYATDLLTCRECGHIVCRQFDSTAEYRFFSNEDRGGDPTRVGAPQDPNLPEASMGTMILNQYGSGKAMYKVRKYHSWNTVPYKERSFLQTCERLSLIGLNSGINQSVIEEAKGLFTTLQEVGGRMGLSRDALLSACIFTSLKNSGSPRKPKEVADIFGLSSAMFTKALKQMQEVMALARQKGLLRESTVKKQTNASTKASEYIQLPLSRLPIPRAMMEHVLMLCKRVAEKADTMGLSQENMPPSLAAGCLAFVLKRCEEVQLPIAKIAEASEISLATLQKCLRRLEQFGADLEHAL